MNSPQNRINWRIGYAAFCLIYVVWVVYLSLDNFDMVHTAYRDARDRMEPARVEEIARRELVDRCRQKQKRRGEDIQASMEEDPCLLFPAAALEKQREQVVRRLTVEKSRFERKVVVFYVSFALVFLALPLAIIYSLVVFLLWILRNVKIIQ